MKTKTINALIVYLLLIFLGCEKPDISNNTDEVNNTPQTLKSNKKRKVLLVGIDGLQFEKIAGVNTPNIDKLNIVRAYSAGITGTASEQKTKSGPGWTTILTGVWLNKHGVSDNSTSNRSQAKSVFQYIKEYNPSLKTSSIATWSPIHDFFTEQMNFVDNRYDGGNDDNAVTRALNDLNTNNPDFLFVHLDEVDGVGHSSGFGTNYNNSIVKADTRLGSIMDAIELREQTLNEDWLIIVTTDHGRSPNGGYSHGDQTLSEKNIFIAMNKTGNEEFNETANSVPNTGFNGLYKIPAQTAIVPTILTYLGVAIKPEFKFNSTSLINTVGPRKVMLDENNKLFWLYNGSESANIYRNNELIATISANQGTYNDTNASTISGTINYTIEINNQIGSVQFNNSNIVAALDWNDALDIRAYFFRNDLNYLRYNKATDQTDAGYPLAINSNNWPGLNDYKNLITAAFKGSNDKGYFFLNNGTYIRYDMDNDSMDSGYPLNIDNSTWPGLENYGNKIVAAFKWNNSKAYFFLNDGTYVRYNLSNDSVDSGYPKAINNSTWPGVENYANMITAAVDWNSQYFYLFLSNNTYIKYNKLTDSAVSGYPKPVNNTTWPGLLN